MAHAEDGHRFVRSFNKTQLLGVDYLAGLICVLCLPTKFCVEALNAITTFGDSTLRR